ncbi:uncharacterized protein [Dermacentor andersoni]|uniref:uncharacterized protein n=1 Tax=Dermacentor andersoni TaxID=34620 RepID=UPI002155B70F|nr:low-density lipoprotein receptor-related protein 1B-like [Dermacentor andersoni]
MPIKCTHGEFDCGDGITCIPSLLWCDGIRDCPNGLDEDCSATTMCKENEFHCPSRSPSDCLPSLFLCDGTDDCLAGADESLCEVCPDSFCLNDGTCSWTLQHRSPVCNCSEGYKGSRCQLLATSVSAEPDRLRVARSSASIVAGVLVAVALAAVGVVTAVVVSRKRRAAQNPRLLYNAASYDVTTEETQFRE